MPNNKTQNKIHEKVNSLYKLNNFMAASKNKQIWPF